MFYTRTEFWWKTPWSPNEAYPSYPLIAGLFEHFLTEIKWLLDEETHRDDLRIDFFFEKKKSDQNWRLEMFLFGNLHWPSQGWTHLTFSCRNNPIIKIMHFTISFTKHTATENLTGKLKKSTLLLLILGEQKIASITVSSNTIQNTIWKDGPPGGGSFCWKSTPWKN